MNGRHAVAASSVFDGDTVHEDFAIITEAETIIALLPRGALPPGIALHECPDGAWLAPGFIDLQVNGGGDVLFNDDPTPQGIAAIAAAHRRFGTTALLPTLISDDDGKMRAAIAAVQSAMPRTPGILGIHLEGPFLNPDKAGVHERTKLRMPTDEDRAFLTARRPGVVLVTLAPERVPAGFVRSLCDAGIEVSLGHSMASYEQTLSAMAEGLTGFTHLFNAMPPIASRAPGPIAAALESAHAYYGLIVDGAHVAAPVLKMALRGAGKPVLVSDAMPPVGGTRSSFTLYGEQITIRGGRCTTADGTLAGSAIGMADAVRNCEHLLDVPLTAALRFASRNPAEFVGYGKSLGRLAPGYRADMVAFDPRDIRVFATWVAGDYRAA